MFKEGTWLYGVAFEKDYVISYYDVDYKKRVFPNRIIDYFQDIALCQSNQLETGIDSLNDANLAWILYQWDIDIYKYPMLNQKLKLRTEPRAFKKFNAYRTFEIYSEAGEKVANGYSKWLVFDYKKGHLVKVPNWISQRYGIRENEEPLNIEEPKEPEREDFKKDFTVRYSDIDTNNHANNSKYVEWAIETIPLEIIDHHILKKLKVTYKNQIKYDEKFTVITEITHNEEKVLCRHKIINNDKISCILETMWV